LINLLLKNVDLFIFSNDMIAKLAITIPQSLERGVKDSICKARHHQNVVLQAVKCRVKAAADMLCLVYHAFYDYAILAPLRHSFPSDEACHRVRGR